MSNHLSASTIQQYRERKLSGAGLLAADDHFAGCRECRERILAGTGARAVAALRSDLELLASEDGDHLSEDQLLLFVDGELDPIEAEIVQSHLEVCEQCEADFNDLSNFRDELASDQVSVLDKVTSKKAKRINFLHDWFNAWTPVGYATAALLLLVAGVVLVLWQMQSKKQTVVAISSPGPSPAPSTTTLPPPVENPTVVLNTDELLALNDNGSHVTVDRAGNVHGLETLPPPTQRLVSSVLTTNNLEFPEEITRLKGKHGTLLGSSEEQRFSLLTPVGIFVRSNRPTLRWTGLNGANYIVTIFDENFDVVATSEPLTSTKWTVSRALQRGRDYMWQVRATVAGKEILSPSPPATEAHFKVISEKTEEELRRTENERPQSHLVRGVLYAKAGLLDEAEQQFRALQKDNPQSPITQKFLRSVQSARRQK